MELPDADFAYAADGRPLPPLRHRCRRGRYMFCS
jgi:hypothetical protein